MNPSAGPNGRFTSAGFDCRDERELVQRDILSSQVIEDMKSMLWIITDGVGSEHGIKHEEIWVLYSVENGGGVLDVLDGRGKKLAGEKRKAVETSLDHGPMEL